MLAIVDIDAQSDASATGDAVRHIASLAERTGWKTYRVPRDFEAVGGTYDALWQVPVFDAPKPALWVGYMAPPDVYDKAYAGLATRNVFLINDPEQHLRAEELDAWYPKLARFTCPSEVVRTPDEAVEAARRIGYPVFLKGTVQSLKVEGLASCRATGDEEAKQLATRLLSHESRTRGRVVVRSMMPLRCEGSGPTGMPVTREFRVFLLDGTVADVGYYWPFSSPLSRLRREERLEVESLALEVQQVIDVPWLAVDIGQLANGDWQMIEIGDAQFAGTCQASPFRLLEALRTHG